MKRVTYKQVNQLHIQGDYYAVNVKKAPLVIFIHGGGLIWGTSNDMKKAQRDFYLNAGYNVYSIEYRLAPESKLPDIIRDIKDCMKWIYELGAKELDFDPENVAIVGSSAGGYLALTTGTFEAYRPKAIVSFYGYGNILGSWYTTPSRHFNKMTKVPEKLAQQLIQKSPTASAPIEQRYAIYLFCRQQGKWLDYVTGLDPVIYRDHLRPFCPVDQIDEAYPPTLLLHGDADEDVPYEESVQMHKALQQHNIESELITIKDGKHTFDYEDEKPVVQDAFKKVVSFLDSQFA